MRKHKLLYLITITYFIIGIANIHFALLGFICMILPMLLLFKDKKKTWCHHYCPRASLYTKIGKLKKHSRKTPRYFYHGNLKWIILTYFGINLFILLMSTFGVANGRMPAMDYLRFLLFFRIPGSLPQLFELQNVAPWLTHLAYRSYSMMMTTTMLGFLMALVYKPRTWCTVCPIATVSDLYLQSNKKPVTKNNGQSNLAKD